MQKCIAILGSTGSIGTQALDVARHNNYKVCALSAHSNIKLLEKQIREFKPLVAAVFNETLAKELKLSVKDTPTKILSGLSGLCECAEITQANIVLNSVVGMVGLTPTLSAINAGKNVALANKETLVAGGKFVMQAAKAHNVTILPVDSEHSAVFQCLNASPPNNALKKITLTASGGPFFGYNKEQLLNVTAENALKHPNWDMGAKITVDSASMMNKGLEIIEAVHLFNLPESKIDVVVHRESIIHSMVEFDDNSVIAQLGVPDMKVPIQYALTYPERRHSPAEPLNLAKIRNLTFFEPDSLSFPLMALCRKAIRLGGLKPAAANGANEQAVALFLKGRMTFPKMFEVIADAMEVQPVLEAHTLEDVFEADRMAREFVLSKCS